MTVKSDRFKQVAGVFATGVTVVTTGESGKPAYGVTVSSLASVSLQPPLILICLDNKLSGLEWFKEGGDFAVNILSEDQVEISDHFATPGTDRTEKIGLYCFSDRGTPILRKYMALMECRLEASYPAGDHTILLGRVLDVDLDANRKETSPLIYYRGRYTSLK